ncbi:phosphoglycerate kinase [Candidatus Kaiserbacteria bacterium CG10_big_fil_rev_8_21_14_0_10_56_12]|uniref:Phosphoglycerate kinase n=1 Tax=Candidatus Kaiserbacteria bacterium CG10_big_fil_rev_8_21_14_0_10_56_12 TaxID=1974611 RepID=A0A2H0U927_9BACT|nr:MAG: phosphoglycerate kinase [Candidatus Kaiserbacteria bacterium CG10_big_fil_rev_8_21_14_0_10_56_12]
MRSVRAISTLENIPVLVRGALNVPIEKGTVTNEYRLRRALATLRHLTERHARVILVGHFDNPNTGTLAPVAAALARLLPHVSFCPESIGPRARDAVRGLAPGHILVLENLRRHEGEMANSPAFARDLAELGDLFVQDSFDTCHRFHASIVCVPKLLPSYAGILLEEEVRELSRARKPKSPSLAIIGGAKFATKEPVLKALLAAYDRLFIGGALANDALKARGYAVGTSRVSEGDLSHVKELVADKRIWLPRDAIVIKANAPELTPNNARTTPVEAVRENEIILDVGPETIAQLVSHTSSAKTIVWNGPLGNYENGFSAATDALAEAIATSSAHSVLGGGDTIAAIDKLCLFSKFSFVSTGGGAMLDFLAHGTLPGIDALPS